MLTRPALGPGASSLSPPPAPPPVRAVVRSGARASTQGGGAPLSDKHAELQRLSDRLDGLLRDASTPATSHREFERQADEAEAIAADLRRIYRGREAGPVNPPLWQDGGRAAW
jgi:hypothetical protein